MNSPDLVSMGREAGTRFGATFAAYSAAFGNRDREGLAATFAPGARVTVRDRRTTETLDLSPAELFDRLYEEVGSARFDVEVATARFEHGYLFADGTWIDDERGPLLRAADLFSAWSDGRFASLDVVWAPSEPDSKDPLGQG